ncbi:MAG: DUF1461 domain-containing protein [Actinobacteria bacterium]|nr:DUF1461 domain-containing protein [Actinomycetota bacterium]
MDFKTGKIKKTLISINSILLIIIILFTPLAYHVCNRGYYETLHEDNGVFSILNKNDVLDATEEIFKFFTGRTTTLQTIQVRYSDESISTAASFRPEEMSHLNDVRKLLVKIFILYCGSIILFVIMTFLLIEKNIKNFIRNMGIIFTISSSVMLFFIIILYFLGENFPVLFENFHQIFFPQGNYAFSGGSLIITLFPYGFFNDFFIRLVLSSTIIAAVLLVTGIIFTNIFKFVKKYGQ